MSRERRPLLWVLAVHLEASAFPELSSLGCYQLCLSHFSSLLLPSPIPDTHPDPKFPREAWLF